MTVTGPADEPSVLLGDKLGFLIHALGALVAEAGAPAPVAALSPASGAHLSPVFQSHS
jgi:hypothetical protein